LAVRRKKNKKSIYNMWKIYTRPTGASDFPIIWPLFSLQILTEDFLYVPKNKFKVKKTFCVSRGVAGFCWPNFVSTTSQPP
jgi:hypothetical protein